MKFIFRDLELDADLLELRRSDDVLEIQPKVLQVLVYLLRNADRTVPKRELLDRIWPDVATTESSLTRAVSVARSQVGKDVIKNVRGEGYRIDVSVERVGRDAADREAPASVATETGFVGRREERRTLDGWLARSPEVGGAGLVLGSPGIGKTRLAQEFTSAARLAGWRVAWGIARPGAPSAYSLWTELLHGIVQGQTTEQLRGQYGRAIEEVADALPELRDRHPELATPRSVARESGRERFFSAMTDLLRSASDARPLVCVIDDVQWADGGSLALLERAMQETAGAPLLWLLVARRGGEVAGEPLDVAVDRWRSGTRILELQGLDVETSEALIQQVARDPEVASVVAGDFEALQERTGGNPLFIQQLVRAGLASERGESRSPALEREALRTVTSVVRERIDRLPNECAEILALAAVVGRRFSTRVVADVLRIDELDALDRLAEAERIGLVLPEQRGRAYVFEHELIREALLDRSTAGALARAHRGIGEVLERSEPGEDPALLSQLAWHFSRGVSRDSAKKAYQYSVRAARSEMRGLAFQNARHHYEDALEIGDPEPKQRATLLIELAEADWCSGDPAAAEIHSWQAIELSKGEGLVELWADAAVNMARWQLHSSGQVAERRVAALEHALRELPEQDEARRVRVIQALVWDLHWSDRRDRARELAFEGARLTERSREPELELLSVSVANHVWCRPEDLARRDRAVERELELVRSVGDPEMEFLAEGHEFGRALEVGDAEALARALEAQASLAEQLRQPRFESAVFSARTNRAIDEGRLDEAERLREANEALTTRRSDDLAILIRAAQLLGLRRFQGRLPELAPLYETGRTRFPAVSGFIAGLGLIALAQGEPERALEECAPLWKDGELSIVHDILYAVSLATVAEIVTEVGNEAQNRHVLEALVPYAGRMMVVNSVSTVGCASRLMGRAAARLGDASEAEHHFAVSLETEQRLRARPWEMYTRLDRARFLEEQSREAEAHDDRERAEHIARETGVPLPAMGD